MVFARYVMFSEVYWHHGVRRPRHAPAGLLPPARRLEVDALFRLTQPEFTDELLRAGGTGRRRTPAGALRSARRLYKRLAEFSILQQRELYQRLARRPYPWLAPAPSNCRLSSTPGPVVARTSPLRRPARAREVQFNVEIYSPKEDAIAAWARSRR